MKEDELIARQAMRIEVLQDKLADLEARIDKANRYIYCVGGPLNDNSLQYSGPQMMTFLRIVEALDGL